MVGSLAPRGTAMVTTEPLVELFLHDPLPLLNPWLRMHWRDRKRRQEAIAWEIRAGLPAPPVAPIERCLIVIVRRSKTHLPDWDGLAASPKALLDCLVVPSKRNPMGVGLIRDDNPACAGVVLTLPAVRRRGEPGTWVRIFPDNDLCAEYVGALLLQHIRDTRAA